MTYTYAILDVSHACYAEIKAKLEAAGYQHAFHRDDGAVVIDMSQIALREDQRALAVLDKIRARCVQDGDCRVWTGPTDRNGYGYVYVSGVGTMLVHRAVWEHFHGPIPDGCEIDHVKDRGCHSRACCNEAHLEPVPHKVNLMRGGSFSANNAAKTHCPQGHPLSGDNLIQSDLRRGQRKCRTCHNARNATRRKTRAERQSAPQEVPRGTPSRYRSCE